MVVGGWGKDLQSSVFIHVLNKGPGAMTCLQIYLLSRQSDSADLGL